MSDENTTDPPIGNAPDLPPASVKTTASITAGAEESSASTDKATPSDSIDTPKHDESRSDPRIRVRWHVDAFVEGQPVLHGFVRDLSAKGADIFLGRNLQNVKSVKLHIHVPPLSVTGEHHIVDVSGKIVYTAHDSEELLFHTGIVFAKFNLNSDLAYLKSRLDKH